MKFPLDQLKFRARHYWHLQFDNARGLTLLEVLIAATLLAFMGIGMVTMTSRSLDTKEQVTKEDRLTMQLELAMNVFNNDFKQIYSPLFYEKLDKDASRLYASKEKSEQFPVYSASGLPVPDIALASQSIGTSSLEFFTSAHRRRFEESHESHYAWVRYQLVTSGQKAGSKELFSLQRTIMADNPYEPERDKIDQIKSFNVFNNFTKLQFLFYNPKSKKFVDNYSEATAGKPILKVVKILFSWVDQAGVETEDERTFYSSWPDFDPSKDKDPAKDKDPDPNPPDSPPIPTSPTEATGEES